MNKEKEGKKPNIEQREERKHIKRKEA